MKVFTLTTAAIAIACAVTLTFVCPPTKAQTTSVSYALVVQDQVALRAAPRESANTQARLWQGELLELRGERMDYMQVWDHQRERGGYVRASQLRRVSFAPEQAESLLSVMRFVKDTPGSEGLTFAYAAAWLKAANGVQANSAAGAEVLDAMGVAAERLARRASMTGLNKAQQEASAGQLDAAQRYGIRFDSTPQDGTDARMAVCYDGELFARVLAMPAATPEQRARAALALTQSDCDDPALALKNPLERSKRQEWRAAVIEKVETAGLSGYLANRVQMRRASLWSGIAFDRTRQGTAQAQVAAQRSLAALSAVTKADLPEEDLAVFNEAAIRVNATRWAAVQPAMPNAQPTLVTTAGSVPGESCVSMILGPATLATRCTFGIVWSASFSLNREATAAALAVQTQEGWREMWVFRKQGGAWSIDVLVPAAINPEIGYVELAGWVPGGRQMLLAREARGEGKYKRSYEVVDLATLQTQRQANDPSILGAFQRWQQPQWQQMSVSLR